MQLRKMTWVLVALSALGMTLTACWKGEQDLSCSEDKDCLESEICHPDDKACVTLCITSATCPFKGQSCEAESTTGNKICICQEERCSVPNENI